VPAGTIYVQQAGGGGGFGDPFERPAEKVAAEVRDGIISVGSARDDYGVAVHPRTLELLSDETAQLRARKEGDA
jgi:N-methylhydantoinase B